MATPKVSSVSSVPISRLRSGVRWRKYGERAALSSRFRRLTSRIVIIMLVAVLPAAIIPAAINWSDPAYRIMEIKAISARESPAVFSTTPAAKPMLR
ncbi:hypothetical protein D3C80_1602600 [compost metagenome]